MPGSQPTTMLLKQDLFISVDGLPNISKYGRRRIMAIGTKSDCPTPGRQRKMWMGLVDVFCELLTFLGRLQAVHSHPVFRVQLIDFVHVWSPCRVPPATS
ncbi:hypothetical protein CA602_11285 [Paraburkholderia hospita]|nr:hypothetical protein CA602_11285 [Paraburkholderia hospita]